MSDLYPYVCECVFKSECALAPSRPQLPAWVGGTEGTEWVCRAIPDPPLPRIGCGGNSGAGVSFVVQMLMCWGHGCVRRKEPRGERSDLAPRGPRSPSSPRETTEKTAAKAPGPKAPPFLCWGGSSTGKMPQVCLERRERGDRAGSQRPGCGIWGPGKESSASSWVSCCTRPYQPCPSQYPKSFPSTSQQPLVIT